MSCWMHVARMYGCVFVCVWGRARMRRGAHEPQSEAHTHARVSARTHAHKRTQAHTRMRSTAQWMSLHTGTRAHTHAHKQTDTCSLAARCARTCTRIHTHTHVRARTHTHTRMRARTQTNTHRLGTPTARAARARSAAGRRRSIGPRTTGTRTWRRRCSRTEPMRMRRTMSGAVAGRYLWATDVKPPWPAWTGPAQCGSGLN
jgi:hypothetical protein